MTYPISCRLPTHPLGALGDDYQCVGSTLGHHFQYVRQQIFITYYQKQLFHASVAPNEPTANPHLLVLHASHSLIALMQDSPPQTPIRATRVPQPRRAESDGIRITTPDPAPAQNADDREATLRNQLARMQQQIADLTNQISARPNPVTMVPSAQQHLSREYWAMSIDKSIKYPGEDAANNAKIAYQQRLDAYLAKSAPVYDLVSGVFPCPITADDQAMQALTGTFGPMWKFEPKHLARSLALLQRDHQDIYSRVFAQLHEGADSTNGSWTQRNAALYTVVCDTLDLSKKGKDLDFLEIVDANNGLAIYNLVKFRLREIKSLDPLARAIKLQMGLQHIKYTAQAHGVAKYFANIDAHRTELASLPRPKIIDDWEVTAKVLRELPALHPKFKSAADILEVQRKILKTETTLEDCRKAFISADIDNDIGGDLHSKNSGKNKRKLRANLVYTDKKPRRDGDRKPGRYNFGDCVHHPKSNTHLSKQCTNPFGLRSAFGLAVSYTDKCTAVKNSVAVGWSPKATNVRIPQGYGCDNPNSQRGSASSRLQPSSHLASAHVRANATTVPPVGLNINPDDFRAYQRVSAIMCNNQTMHVMPPARVHHPIPPATHTGYPHAHSPARSLHGSPIRTFHSAPAYGSPQRPIFNGGPPGFPHRPQTYHHPQPFRQPAFLSPNHGPPAPYAPAPIAANSSSIHTATMPRPTQEDLVTAGIRYFATQTGDQDFR